MESINYISHLISCYIPSGEILAELIIVLGVICLIREDIKETKEIQSKVKEKIFLPKKKKPEKVRNKRIKDVVVVANNKTGSKYVNSEEKVRGQTDKVSGGQPDRVSRGQTDKISGGRQADLPVKMSTINNLQHQHNDNHGNWTPAESGEKMGKIGTGGRCAGKEEMDGNSGRDELRGSFEGNSKNEGHSKVKGHSEMNDELSKMSKKLDTREISNHIHQNDDDNYHHQNSTPHHHQQQQQQQQKQLNHHHNHNHDDDDDDNDDDKKKTLSFGVNETASDDDGYIPELSILHELSNRKKSKGAASATDDHLELLKQDNDCIRLWNEMLIEDNAKVNCQNVLIRQEKDNYQKENERLKKEKDELEKYLEIVQSKLSVDQNGRDATDGDDVKTLIEKPLSSLEENATNFNSSRLTTTSSAMITAGQKKGKISLQFVFVGDSGVGKTSFMRRLSQESFTPSFSATVGIDFVVKTLQVDNCEVLLQLWDTAGQERFRSLTKQYFRKADGVLLIYDVTSENSFKNVRKWMQDIQEGTTEGTVVAIVGNKRDLVDGALIGRVVTALDGADLAKEYDALFYESSAKTGQGVLRTVHDMISFLVQRRNVDDLQMEREKLRLDNDYKSGKPETKCCAKPF